MDPMNEDYDDEPQAYDDDAKLTEPSGEDGYLLAIDYFHETRSNDKGSVWHRVKLQVLAGKHAGSRFWDSIFVHQKSHHRLSHMCRAMGWTERFNPENGDDFKRALMGRPFMAAVKIRVNGKYNDPQISKTLGDIPADLKQTALKWREEWELNGGNTGNGGSSSGGGGGSSSSGDRGDFTDDDIPFAINTIEHGDPLDIPHDPTRGVVR